MKLYYHPLSGHSHRARLFLSLLGVEHELVEVDLMKGEHKSPEFLKLNRFGQVPALVDGGTTIADSNAILVYIAKKLGKTEWLPETPEAGGGHAALAVGSRRGDRVRSRCGPPDHRVRRHSAMRQK